MIENLSNNKNSDNNNIITIDDNQELQKDQLILEEKEKEIVYFNNQLLDNVNNEEIKFGEKLIVININSKDNKIYFPITCKTSTKFAEIERIFYKKFPDYCNNDEEVVFKRNGLKMKGFKTMAENGFPGFELIVEKIN